MSNVSNETSGRLRHRVGRRFAELPQMHAIDADRVVILPGIRHDLSNVGGFWPFLHVGPSKFVKNVRNEMKMI